MKKELFKALESLNTKKLTYDEKLDLLSVFNHTKDHAIRDLVATIFAETKFDRAVPFILKKISDKDVVNHTGTLVYALSDFDLKPYLINLLDIVYRQAFESKLTAYQIIIRLLPDITIGQKEKALGVLKKYKVEARGSVVDDDTLDFINKLINHLK